MASQHSCLLSPLDQLMPKCYIRVLLAFAAATPVDANAVNSLRSGLEQTCAQLPYLKGRVTEQDHGRLAISWSDHDPAPPFSEIRCPSDIPSSYERLKEEGFPLKYASNSLWPVAAWGPAAFPDGSGPALAASYTCLEGGIFITLSIHHNVMDGTGTGRLIELWGRNTNDLNNVADSLPDAQEPVHRQEWLKTASLTAPRANNDSAVSSEGGNTYESLLSVHPEYRKVAPTLQPPPSGCNSKIFAFSVQKLKATATASNTSVNNVLCAIVWSCISTIRSLRWRNESSSGNGAVTSSNTLATTSKLGMAVNGRHRFADPQFSSSDRPYMGNVNLYAVAAIEFSTLVALGASTSPESPPSYIDVLGNIIRAIATSFTQIDNAFITEVMYLADKAPNARGILHGWDYYNSSDLTITSWANLDTYAVDFGPSLGRPDFLRVPFAEADGMNIVLPRRRGGTVAADEIIEMVVMLRNDDMQELERNAMWQFWTDVHPADSSGHRSG